MRRSVNLIFLLTLLSAGILTGGTLVLGGRGDQVTVTARTLAGDPSAAEGLTVNLPLVLEDCLFWDLSFPADHPEQAVTQFRYDPEGEPPVYTSGSASVGLLMNHSIVDHRDPLGEGNHPDWTAMLEELATGMRPDSQRHCAATLTDYMECWPMEAYLPDCALSSKVLNQLMTDYFAIPIPQDYEAEFELTVDSQGTLTRAVCYGDDRYQFQGSTWCFETPQGYLFTFSNTYYDWEQNESLLLDGSRLPAGWGLYRLTVNGDSTGGQLETVYSLPEGSEILDFLAAGDQSAYFLLTREEGMLRLRVFDRSIALQDTFDLLPMEEGDHYIQTYWGGDFLVPILYVGGPDSCRLAVVAPGSQGWQPHFTFSLAEQAALGFGGISRQDTSWYPLAMDYAHGRLTIRDGNGGANFYLAVYDGGELAYLGTYESSLTIPAVLETEYDLASSQSSVCYLPRTATLPLVAWPETAS